MSLLIKALQKAEEEKTADGSIGASMSELSLEPRDSGQRLDDGSPQRVEPTLRADPRPAQQQAAAGVFSAKQPKSNGTGSKKLLLIGAVSLLLLLLIGMQLYSYIDSLNQPVMPLPRPHVQPQPATTAVPQQPVISEADGAVSPQAPQPNGNTAASGSAAAPKTETGASEAALKTEPAEKAPVVAPIQKTAPKPSEEVVMGAPVAKPEGAAVKITRNPVVVGVNPDLEAGYKAYMAEDFALTKLHYQQVLRTDVRNMDALLGMAAIALKEGRMPDAAGWYGKVLEVDPRNTIAQAAMVSGLAQADPVAAESHIKNLLTQKPEAAYLYAALGSLYAQRTDWPQAQQAYFQAYHFAPANADYAFNLAISLDHLGKSSLALQYYRQALELMPTSGSANIDRAQLESRILQLQ
ncbi:MAG TPA: hypothetical protein VFS17_01640 [Methylophilaceae bacterium]|nr:hypothetical protein [Methylophilaceae bacterium]